MPADDAELTLRTCWQPLKTSPSQQSSRQLPAKYQTAKKRNSEDVRWAEIKVNHERFDTKLVA